MLHEPPIPGSVLHGILRDRSAVYREDPPANAEEEGRVVRRVVVTNLWCKITADTTEWWVGDNKGNIYEPRDLFRTKAEAEASLLPSIQEVN